MLPEVIGLCDVLTETRQSKSLDNASKLYVMVWNQAVTCDGSELSRPSFLTSGVIWLPFENSRETSVLEKTCHGAVRLRGSGASDCTFLHFFNTRLWYKIHRGWFMTGFLIACDGFARIFPEVSSLLHPLQEISMSMVRQTAWVWCGRLHVNGLH